MEIVLSIARKLKRFPRADMSGYIDLYNSEFPAINAIKSVFNQYIHDSSENMSGRIPFNEIGREIVYTLPVKRTQQPYFVMRKM